MYPVSIELTTLFCGPFDSQLPGILVGLTLHDLPGQRLGDIAVERLRHHRQLTQFRHRLDAGDDGDGDAHCPGLLHKSEILLVIIEQLGDRILRAQILFLLQILHVHLQVRRLLVLLGIAGHAVVEFPARPLDGCAVGEEPLVEALYLPDQVRRMRVTAGRRHKPAVLLRLVATQQQDVADAEELQVEQLILDVLDRRAAADHVGLYGDIIPLLDGSCYRHRSRAPAHPNPFKPRLVHISCPRAFVPPLPRYLAVHELRVVGGDVDVGGVELAQFVDVCKQAFRARPLQRGQHLKREPPALFILMDEFRYAHNWPQRYEKNTTDCTD